MTETLSEGTTLQPRPSPDGTTVRLDREGQQPLYQQIAEQFRRRIKSRLWPAGYRLLNSDLLAVDLGVARGTVRRAIQQLADEGLLVQVHGRGTFVTATDEQVATRPAAPDVSNVSSGERLAREGVFFETEVLDREVVTDAARIGPFMGGKVLRVHRLRRLAEGPDASFHTDLLVDAIPGIELTTNDDLAAGGLRTLLRTRFGVGAERLERMFSAVLADDVASALLDVPVGAPLLSFEEFAFDNGGRCFEHSHALVRTDRHPVVVDI